MPTLLDKWLCRSALSRNEAQIALKIDEISRTEKAQADDLLTIQRRIDRIDTQIFDLKKQRKSVEKELATAERLNGQRLAQLAAELAELKANEAALSQPDVITAAEGRTLTIKTGGENQ